MLNKNKMTVTKNQLFTDICKKRTYNEAFPKEPIIKDQPESLKQRKLAE
jgi:hypothetical protein